MVKTLNKEALYAIIEKSLYIIGTSDKPEEAYERIRSEIRYKGRKITKDGARKIIDYYLKKNNNVW